MREYETYFHMRHIVINTGKSGISGDETEVNVKYIPNNPVNITYGRTSVICTFMNYLSNVLTRAFSQFQMLQTILLSLQ